MSCKVNLIEKIHMSDIQFLFTFLYLRVVSFFSQLFPDVFGGHLQMYPPGMFCIIGNTNLVLHIGLKF